MTRASKASKAPRPGGWQRWHFFAIAAAGVAVIGGVWGVLAGGGPQPAAPTPSPTATVTATTSVTPAP